MAFENLGERERKVLASLITHYINSADPVGSRAIATKFDLGISPATIRNTMQDLEEMGLVRQPHTSAGRVPTDSGYRLFVDMLLRQEEITEADRQMIDSAVGISKGGIETILEQTTRILADLSSQLGVTLAPRMDESVLSRIELIQMASDKVLVVLVLKSGLARTILVEVEAELDQIQLLQMAQALNEKLAGLNLGQIRSTIRERLKYSGGAPKLLKLFLDGDSEIWHSLEADQIKIGGRQYIINQPEFANREKLQTIVTFLEEKTGLIKALKDVEGGQSGLVITIGGENHAAEIQNCSVVSAQYSAGTTTGTIGIIGPTRMPYARLVSLVQYAARQLSRAFQEK